MFVRKTNTLKLTGERSLGQDSAARERKAHRRDW